MSTSTTIIAALKYEGGVVIAADSQASDQVAGVRWPFEKLERVGQHPLVVGFSGSVGMTDRARRALEAIDLHPNAFRKRELIEGALDRGLDPVYQIIKTKNAGIVSELWKITIWGLAAFWAEDAPQILEREFNGDACFHEYFHAIGSGSNTAYAIWRTLGGRRLAGLSEQKSLQIMLRILRTCVDVEMFGVDEPLSIWIVNNKGARELAPDEIQAELQYVSEWEEQERRAFFAA